MKNGRYLFEKETDSGKLESIINIFPEGEFSITTNFDIETGVIGNGLDCDGTYVVKLNVEEGSTGVYKNGIEFTTETGTTFFCEVTSDESFENEKYKYNYDGIAIILADPSEVPSAPTNVMMGYTPENIIPTTDETAESVMVLED